MTVAVIGAGAWGKNLVENFHRLGRLAAVAEPSSTLRADLAARYPTVPLWADHRAMLSRDEITAVAIAPPLPTHHPQAPEAPLARKDVFVEKPLTMSAADAADLVALAEERGRVLMVGHLLLYQPAIRWIKAYLDAGELGRVYALHQERLNLGRARAVENALWSLGVHDVAVMLYLVGEPPADVRAVGQRALQPGVEDDVHLHLAFPGGCRAHLHTSWLWPEKRRRLTVVGERGMIVFDELEGAVTLHRKRIGPDLAHADAGSEVVFQGSQEPLDLELRHFLARVRDRGPVLSSGGSGAEVVRVLELATRQLEVNA